MVLKEPSNSSSFPSLTISRVKRFRRDKSGTNLSARAPNVHKFIFFLRSPTHSFTLCSNEFSHATKQMIGHSFLFLLLYWGSLKDERAYSFVFNSLKAWQVASYIVFCVSCYDLNLKKFNAKPISFFDFKCRAA